MAGKVKEEVGARLRQEQRKGREEVRALGRVMRGGEAIREGD